MTVQLRSRWTTAIAVAALIAPAAATAQDTTATAPAAPRQGRTHTVRTGDTLWDLARTYLNDPFLWPEIYRLNTEVVEDPHWIYPGEVLRLPDGSIAAVAEGPAAEAPAEEAPSSAGSTVFAGGGMRAGRYSRGGRRDLLGRTPPPLVRAGDYYAAPSVGPERGLPGAGRIGDRVEVSGIARISATDRLQQHDVVEISLPSGRVALQGERYLTYRIDEALEDRGAVLVPTGVLQVERVRAGETLARIVEAYDQVRVGQHVVPLDSFAETPRRAPARVADGVRAKVLWISGNPVLPSLNRYLVLSARASDGIAIGDQFTLYGRTDDQAPAQSLAIVQVVKVTPGGVTGMIIDQMAPGIAIGTPARLTAKMP